ncbi:MAG TPA: hypothetical protein VKM72_30550 [Thermoanaerobaculia bacterium]|nr:hypothetical protein [Thermoanaerobaculia bacterium]
MSSQPLRRVLAGTLMVAFLSLGSAWQWLTELVLPVDEEVTAPASDAGWVVDPDG